MVLRRDVISVLAPLPTLRVQCREVSELSLELFHFRPANPTFRMGSTRYRATTGYGLRRNADTWGRIRARTFLCSLLSSGSNT